MGRLIDFIKKKVIRYLRKKTLIGWRIANEKVHFKRESN